MESSEITDTSSELKSLNLDSSSANADTDSCSVGPILPWDKFFNWIYCVGVVAFDLELGQAIELIYPSHVKLSDKEKMNICYLSFPDSNSGCMGNTQFHFRVRQSLGRLIESSIHSQYNKECLSSIQIDFSHYYGFVYFRQVKDKSLRRGYFQKSLIILTRFPFIRLFTRVLQILAPEYFRNGEPSIEAACHDIDQWPPPVPGTILHLPVLGMVLQVRIPTYQDISSIFCTEYHSSPHPCFPAPLVLPSVYEVDIFRCFSVILSHIHLLWELVITAEPIVVMASSPTICSEMVQALISMISPMKYGADFQPYFTIHNSEFKEYTSRNQIPPPVILGVTNPFFAKTLQHWPHIIRLGDCPNYFSPELPKHKIKKTGQLKTIDSKPGVYTLYKPFLHKDKTILKKLLKGIQTKRPIEVQNALLKRHLMELTQSFIIPLERYMASLMPFQRNISPHKATPSLKPFNPDDFLKSLESSGPQLTTGVKGDWSGLYRKFFQSVNFRSWYTSRYKEVSRKLQALHVEALSEADLHQWMKNKEEVEVVDLILQIKTLLAATENDNLPVTKATKRKLISNLEGIISNLPEDLQRVLPVSW